MSRLRLFSLTLCIAGPAILSASIALSEPAKPTAAQTLDQALQESIEHRTQATEKFRAKYISPSSEIDPFAVDGNSQIMLGKKHKVNKKRLPAQDEIQLDEE